MKTNTLSNLLFQQVLIPKYIAGLLLFIICNPSYAQSPNENYVLTKTYKIETSTSIPTPNATEAAVSIKYFDGLGRPKQEVANRMAGNGGDLITNVSYDALGRQIKEYLPYVRSASLTLDPTGVASTIAYYASGEAGQPTDNPYTQTLYENSALNRVLKLAAPGNDWAMDSGHEIELSYETNQPNDVHHFGVSLTGSSPSLKYYNKYPSRQLYKTVTKNENWKPADGTKNTTEEYKNKMGHVILKRTFERFEESGIGRERTLETYYVYDIYGNLTFVLPPKLSSQIPSNGILSQELVDALGYQYRYDQRNRMTEKKIPGKQKETIQYDALNRIISTGPVSSPFGDNSIGTVHTKYDIFDRVVYTFWKQGIGANPFGIEPQVYLSESRTPGTTVINGVELSYSNNVQPKSGEILSVHYYDDYTYKDAPSPIPSGVGENNAISIKYNNNTVPQGLPTGSWTRLLETASQKQSVKSYTLYDKKARAVRVATFYPNNGKTITDTDFNFIGNPSYTLTTHKLNASADELKVKETYTYTAQSRLARVTHQINNLPAQILSVNSYDDLGRLQKKKVGGTNLFGGDELQIVDYKYNIRGWLTDINNVNNLNDPSGPVDLFAFRLNYNTVTDNINGQVEPLYNGNISETFWRTATDNIRRKYGYSYDHQNRLKAAYFQLPGTVSPHDGSFNSAYSYDDNGNILSLERYEGSSNPAVPPIEIDDLEYAYDNGNKLLEVTDATANPSGFNRNGALPNAKYTYDNFGNLKSDPYKKIINITYNHLNLPIKITFVGGETIAYTYLADGRKIRKIVQDSQSNTNTTAYMEGFQYKNESLEFFPHTEGYAKATQTMNGSVYNHVYTHTDHLGNIRIKYTKHPQTGDLEILEENHYYPYGLTHSGYNEAHLVVGFEQPGTDITLIEVTLDVSDTYKYKFGGKEWQDEFDVNMYDFGARNYDPALGRWMNIDPLAEMMRRHSPYNYAFDNPVYFIDPDGMAPMANDWIDNEDGTYTPEKGDSAGSLYNQHLKDKGYTEEETNAIVEEKYGENRIGEDGKEYSNIKEGDEAVRVEGEEKIGIIVLKNDTNLVEDNTDHLDKGNMKILDLTYTKEDRAEKIRGIAELGKVLTDQIYPNPLNFILKGLKIRGSIRNSSIKTSNSRSSIGTTSEAPSSNKSSPNSVTSNQRKVISKKVKKTLKNRERQ